MWDEASMAHKHNIGALDAMLFDVYRTKQLSGGKVIVFGAKCSQLCLGKHNLKLLNYALLTPRYGPDQRNFG